MLSCIKTKEHPYTIIPLTKSFARWFQKGKVRCGIGEGLEKERAWKGEGESLERDKEIGE